MKRILSPSDKKEKANQRSNILSGTCSAAVGSRVSIAWAALLFLVVMAAAKGVNPFLSLKVRSILGWASRREIITACWFSMAIWTGVLPSMS